MSGLQRKPRAGDRILYRGQPYGVVARVEGNLCWTTREDGTTDPFIWNFPRDGRMNLLFSIDDDRSVPA